MTTEDKASKLAREIMNFLTGIDWSVSSSHWKQDRIAALLRTYLGEQRFDEYDAMLVRRLAYRHPNTKLVDQALGYLRGEGLQGSILREPAPPTEESK